MGVAHKTLKKSCPMVTTGRIFYTTNWELFNLFLLFLF